MVKVSLTKLDGTKMEKLVEKPKYGGTFTYARSTPPVTWDRAYSNSGLEHLVLIYDKLATGRWELGPSGTDEMSWRVGMPFIEELSRGEIAESWEYPDYETNIFHIRKGVHFGLNPASEASRLVNGRELTADDVAYTFNRQFSFLGSFDNLSWPLGGPFGPSSITATDRYTVVMKHPVESFTSLWEMPLGSELIVPREVLEKYGGVRDWRNAVGAGPWMVTDFISGVSITFKKNPDYWMKDPIFPENTLPYIDTLKWLIILDASTRMAALRTGKVDTLPDLNWEDAKSLIQINPELKYQGALWNYATLIQMRSDTKPFDDIRVRRALNMAIDKKKILDTLYGGKGEVFAWPTAPHKDIKMYFLPLEEHSAAARELFEYKPDKAKQLLAEAGYPNGFKTEVVLYPALIDLASVVKDYWSKIGVDLTLDVKEFAVYVSTGNLKTHKATYMNQQEANSGLYSVGPWITGNQRNKTMVNDPVYISKTRTDYNSIGQVGPRAAEGWQILKDRAKWVLDNAWEVALPTPYVYTFWQPWVKGYNGEYIIGFGQAHSFPKYIWIDQDLKEKMTGRR